MRYTILPIALAVCASTACDPGATTPTGQAGQLPRDDGVDAPHDDGTGSDVSFDPLIAVQISGIEERSRRVIDDPDEWAAFWAEATQMLVPSPDLPAVDFTRDVVVAATMGTRSTAGYMISIEAVQETDDAVVAVVRELSPGANCLTAQVLTAPVTAVRVTRPEKALTFEEQTATSDCG